eukprot:1192397-Prorocentrum_minimum.AAC.2
MVAYTGSGRGDQFERVLAADTVLTPTYTQSRVEPRPPQTLRREPILYSLGLLLLGLVGRVV